MQGWTAESVGENRENTSSAISLQLKYICVPYPSACLWYCQVKIHALLF